MGVHANAKLGPAGRRELVRLIREGSTERQAAAALSVAPATAHRWSVRECEASPEQRASGAWALDRSQPSAAFSAPDRRRDEQRVCQARERTGWGPRLIAGETGVAHSTVHAILAATACSRAAAARARDVRRYEWPCPGDLLHMDVKRYPRFRRPGHAVTGDRTRSMPSSVAKLGDDFFHAVVDDHCAWPTASCSTTSAPPPSPLLRARAGVVCRSTASHAAADDRRRLELHPQPLARRSAHRRDIRHIVTPPYTPRWNGKVERFHQTMEREWAKGLRYRNQHARNQALPHWLTTTTSAAPQLLGGRPPISRAHNLSGQDT